MESPSLIATCWTTSGTARPLDASEVASCSPQERVEAVAAGGWAGLGFAHEDLAAMREGPGFPRVARAARDAGLAHVEVELITDWWLGEESWRERWDLLLEAADAFDSPFIKAGTAFSEPWTDLSGLVGPLRRLAVEAGQRGVRVALEPLPFSMVGSVPAAADLVRAVDHPAAALAVDYWHVFRAGTSLDELTASLTLDLVAAVELNDADAEPVGTLFEDTRDRRRYCGEGAQDVPGFIRVLEQLGYRGPWGVEILSDEHRAAPLDEGLARARSTTLRCFEAARA
ncbi:sugar phosphate isomerase/epimerase family protein [Kineococcus rubinsiae]|uniref:sugar phosphate isomerase/epimerase family protein n=1 Tax=Kineococcus rubinsiae TaxID=2609562 RepID=UPI0014307B17|nr:sugar phosphate isomerase/epimerase family protein [Kineococcus rubinsiae]NIZ92276.1 sugar phosphate isomerase/epimerase [Kineococcus rubinsiae]